MIEAEQGYEEIMAGYKAANLGLTVALASLEVYGALGLVKTDALTRALVDQVLVDHGFPAFGNRLGVSDRGLLAQYLGYVMVDLLTSWGMAEGPLTAVGVLADGTEVVLEEVGFDGDYVQVMIRQGDDVVVAPVTLAEFMNGSDVTDWLMLTRVQVVTSFRGYFAKEGKPDGRVVLNRMGDLRSPVSGLPKPFAYLSLLVGVGLFAGFCLGR